MKQVISWLCIAVLCIGLSVSVLAQPLQTERKCSLSLQLAVEDTGFSGVDVSVYRIAQAHPDGTLDTIAPFTDCAVSLYDITDAKGWSDLANTLSDYVLSHSILATVTTATDLTGQAKVTDLPTGLYLVDGVVIEKDNGSYTFDPFMVYLPTQNEGEYTYDVVAKPKVDRFEPAPKGTEYRVLKLWNDNGYTSHRTSIQVEIRKDGEWVETVTLSDANNWSYAWTDPGQSRWTVVELNVPNGYTAVTEKRGTTFVMINTRNADTPIEPDEPIDPPGTGDTSLIWLYVLTMCLSGLGLIILGLISLRGNRYEKNHR